MLCGITAYHIRILCENTFEGGAGYTPNEVGDMTLDQVFMRLVERKALISKDRSKSISALEAVSLADDDGTIKGRDKDGNLIVGRIAGVSKAKQLRLAQVERERLEKEKQPPKRKRRRRK